MPSASYTEIVVLFLYRVSELVSRIAVLALALIDIMHCHLPEEPSQPCPFRGCLLGNPSCEACSCKYKESVIEAIIAEFLFLLIFLRVTATQDNAQDMNAIEKLQNQVKIWACCLCNMQGIYMTPTKTMITYLGLKQAETAYIGEVKLLDGFVLLCIRAISNAGLLIIFTQVGERHDLWSETGSTALLYAGMASGPVQIIIAYVRYIIWDKIEQRVEMRFKLMSKREQILSSRGKEAGTDQTKTLSNSLDMLGKIMQPYHKREQRRKALMESSRDEPSNTKKHQRDGEPMFWNVKRQSARLPGDRHVLPLAVPEFVIFPSSNSGLEGNAVRDGEGGDIHDAGVLPIKASTQTGSEDAALEVESPVHLNDGPGGQAHQSAIPKRLDLDLLEQGVKWITQFDLNFESDAGNKVSNVWIFSL
jgi:hypothetical protein